MSIAMDLVTAARAMAGTTFGENIAFAGVSTDSRQVGAGQLFFALRGDKFDGHDYLNAVRERGAVAAVVDADAVGKLAASGLPLIAVSDTRRALGTLAADWRSRFSLPLIAVTGSNGKTTTKEMIASILKAAFGDAVLATQGNFNNDIGLPLTLLGLNTAHRAAIVEMGMNHPGEIGYLAAIARPSVALVTNVQRAHLAGMGTLEAIAREKGAIYERLADDGVALFDAGEAWTDLWREQAGGRRTLTFALNLPADVQGLCTLHGLENLVAIEYDGEQIEVALAQPGEHNARNAIAAAAASLAAGIELDAVRRGLVAFKGIKGRLQRATGPLGATVLDDTYNANPDSVRAGIDVLASTVGKKILVLGDMGELGWMTGQYHDEIGGYAKSQGVDCLLALGDSSLLAARNFGVGGRHFRKIDDLLRILTAELTPDSTVLVKGSRFMRMERVVQGLVEQVAAESATCC